MAGLGGFANFLADSGPRPRRKTLDRKNPFSGTNRELQLGHPVGAGETISSILNDNCSARPNVLIDFPNRGHKLRPNFYHVSWFVAASVLD